MLVYLLEVGGKGHRGYSTRTTRYCYTEWVDRKHKKKWGKILGPELYDHVTDLGENRNCAGEAAYQQTVP